MFLFLQPQTHWESLSSCFAAPLLHFLASSCDVCWFPHCSVIMLSRYFPSKCSARRPDCCRENCSLIRCSLHLPACLSVGVSFGPLGFTCHSQPDHKRVTCVFVCVRDSAHLNLWSVTFYSALFVFLNLKWSHNQSSFVYTGTKLLPSTSV